MLDSFYNIANVAVAVSFLLATVALYNFNRFNNILKLVSIYLVASAGIDLVSLMFALNGLPNLIFFHLFTLFEFIVLSVIFNAIFVEYDKKQWVKKLCYPVAALIVVNTAILQDFTSYNSISGTITSVLIIFYSIYYFYLLVDSSSVDEQSKLIKWFIICVFIYHSFTLIILLFSNQMVDISKETQAVVWILRSIVILLSKLVLLSFFLKFIYQSIKSKKSI